MSNFDGIAVKDGYELMCFMKYSARPQNTGLAIIHRLNVDDYVLCHMYDVKDGTWGQGVYVETYLDAWTELHSWLANRV